MCKKCHNELVSVFLANVLLLSRDNMTKQFLQKKIFLWASFQWFTPLSAKQQTSWHKGKCSGEAAVISKSRFTGSRKREKSCQAQLRLLKLKSPPPVTYFFQPGYPYSKKTIPPNSFKQCYSLSNQIYELMGGILIQTINHIYLPKITDNTYRSVYSYTNSI